ncbi:MAG: amidohydrolase family protein [Gammaproteobacteria bacterium]
MTDTTVIRGATWVAAWDGSAERHVYRRGVDVAFTGDRIVHVGPGYTGECDHEIDGQARFVIPGLVNIHAHPHTEPAYKGIREDHGRPEMYDTGLQERSAAFDLDEEGHKAAAVLAYGELLLSGVTSITDLSAPLEDWVELLAASGLRGFVAPGFASSSWYLKSLHQVSYAWDEAAGRAGLEQALQLMDRAEQHPCGRLSGVVYPYQIDTCTEALLRDAAAAAADSGRPLTTHASQSMVEFLEMARRHGKTPLQWASEIGFLGPRTIIGHAIFIDEHPSVGWRIKRDLGVLADSGATVAHCPSPFARYGHAMADFGRYRRAGVRLGFGTDVAPHNLIEEMRLAVVAARIMADDIRTTDTADVFHAATVGGATALGRDDLGHIAPGAKADLVLVDLDQPAMRPVRDPLRTLVWEAADRAVCEVFVDGQRVVADGRVLTLDLDDAAMRLEDAQRRMMSAAPKHDFLGRQAEEIAPLSLPVR